MDAPDPIIVTPRFRELVAALGNRLGPHVVIADRRWKQFATSLAAEAGLGGAEGDGAAPAGLGGGEGDDAAPVEPDEPGPVPLVVGPPAFVLAHARGASGAFGFVMPDARTAHRWQRVRTWRDDATRSLWRIGWSPVDIDRLVVVDHVGAFEFVIGNARSTPTVAPHRSDPASALDDGD